MRELGQLADRKDQFAKLGTKVYAIAVAPREELADLQEDLGEAVTVLADPRGEAVERFGVLDPHPFPAGRTARSAVFLVDERGAVRYRWFPASYRERTDPDAILHTIQGLP